MLVCSVIQSRRRAAIAADVAEAAAALDAPGTGNVVFATLVDDPASVRETVDAFLGQIMREAASAASIVSANASYAAAIVEAAAAADAPALHLPTVFGAAVTEAGAAADVLDTTAVRSAAVSEAATASDTCSAASVAVQKARVLSASRAGVGSVVVSDDGSGKTRIIADIGAMT